MSNEKMERDALARQQIWIDPDNPMGFWEIEDPEDESIEYIRADLAAERERVLWEALKAARQFIVLEGFPIGWSVSRIDEVLAQTEQESKDERT
jgi:hypothetical protein